MRRMLVTALPLALLLSACEKPAPRLNAPPHGDSPKASAMRDMYDHMIDNAMLEDMALTDAHFLPHRAVLNGLGVERLARYAILMELYGGTLRFSSDEEDKALVDARTTTIRTRLGEAGLDTSAQIVVNDLPAGAGMNAAEAILIKANEGTYKAKKNAAASPGAGAANPDLGGGAGAGAGGGSMK